jgi:hypothetical protein
MSEKRVNHPSPSPATDPASFWHRFVELGLSHAHVLGYILRKLPNTPEWVKLLRQVDTATRHVVSQAVSCIHHSPHSPPLQAPLEEVFPAAYQLRTGYLHSTPVEVSLSLDALASSAPQLLSKLQRVTLVCASFGGYVGNSMPLPAITIALMEPGTSLEYPWTSADTESLNRDGSLESECSPEFDDAPDPDLGEPVEPEEPPEPEEPLEPEELLEPEQPLEPMESLTASFASFLSR